VRLIRDTQMNRVYFLLVLFALGLNVFPQTVKVLEKKNSYGGNTVERINAKDKVEAERWAKVIEYYDGSDIVVKRIFTLSQTLIKETGIIEQTNYYNGAAITRYEMKYTEEFIKTHDFDKMTEDVGNGGFTVRTIWYKGNNIIDVIDYPEDINRFPFYNIKYLESVYISPNSDASERNRVLFEMSAKYPRIRSVVKFDTELFDLDELDVEGIKWLGLQFGQPDFIKYYSKKVKVYHKNSYYWLYVQRQVEDAVKGQEATIRYYPMARDKKLYLMCIGFFDVHNPRD